MSGRDRLEVAVRSQLNSAVRVPRWRHAAKTALIDLRGDGSVNWREGLVAWLDHRDDPPLARARTMIETDRKAMLRDNTPISDGKTSLTTIANACNKMSIPRQLGELLYWLIKTSAVTSVLELGTALGFSAAYMAAALSPGGRLRPSSGDP